MAIIKAKHLGFCEGGRNSINSVIELANQGERVYVYGELLHNKSVIAKLEQLGITFLEPNPDVKVDGKLVIRAHGISNKLKQKLALNNEIVDLTCPKVRKIHALSKFMESKGYHIAYLGKPGHPEAEGTLGNLTNATLVTSLEDVKAIPHEKLAFLAQSTASLEEFNKIANYLRAYKPSSVVFNTICDSTLKRQRSAAEVAARVDLMVVVGGKNSANTRQLYEICKKHTTTIWIETPDEILNYKEEIEKANDIGLTAGASTPDEDIDTVFERISKLNS
ncbi:4-hydroxy-3-methylbut-2-enyl diphosphate reductase [Candidatus Woesearchaeota archaeon]|nr:4-hydroxy-3-methylbut-2-enyl diphosphate reductase [Candidatus Woesearchaeota archaeon]RLE43407.1 MAG: 4-hydroxy-3-methylbut-2-enyl diphosphate reductase [Candidatus Woesearchaeota archaeon]